MTDRFADGNPANDPPGDDRAAPRGWHGGDFAGIEQHLDYLQQLGVTAVWTTPVASNGGDARAPITATRPPISTQSIRTLARSTTTGIFPPRCTRGA